MKYLKLLSISLLMFIFAIACQAGEDNRIVYDENTSDVYSETMEEGDKEDHEGDDDHEGHDHEGDKVDHVGDEEVVGQEN